VTNQPKKKVTSQLRKRKPPRLSLPKEENPNQVEKTLDLTPRKKNHPAKSQRDLMTNHLVRSQRDLMTNHLVRSQRVTTKKSPPVKSQRVTTKKSPPVKSQPRMVTNQPRKKVTSQPRKRKPPRLS